MANKRLSIPQTAELIGISAQTIYRHLESDPQSFPPYQKLGKRITFIESDVLAWLERNSHSRNLSEVLQ